MSSQVWKDLEEVELEALKFAESQLGFFGTSEEGNLYFALANQHRKSALLYEFLSNLETPPPVPLWLTSEPEYIGDSETVYVVELIGGTSVYGPSTPGGSIVCLQSGLPREEAVRVAKAMVADASEEEARG